MDDFTDTFASYSTRTTLTTTTTTTPSTTENSVVYTGQGNIFKWKIYEQKINQVEAIVIN